MKKETYEGFNGRLDDFEKAEYGIKDASLIPNNSVHQKFDGLNQFRPFFGDTLVFGLQSGVISNIKQIISEMYTCVPNCFSARIDESTMHMTLHDLSSSPIVEKAAAEARENYAKICEISHCLVVPEITMKTNFVVDMNRTSLVLALKPINKEEFLKLMQLYYIFDNVRSLSYKLTPHITLGYYNANGFDQANLESLASLVKELNQKTYFEFVLGDLLYQRFISMNHYETVLNLSKPE